MASYSAFFSSGLRASPPPPPASPVVPDILMEDLCFDTHNFPSNSAPSSASSSMVNVVQDSTNISHRPILRKRRSSLTLGSTPMASIKSPVRSAGNALQRHYSTLSVTGSNHSGGTRSRSGSNAGLKPPSSSGETTKTRSRSGSVGTALRPRGKSVRRAALPPPSAPLPPLPAMPSMPTTAPPNQVNFDHHSNVNMTPSTPERVHSRAYSSENGYRICEESP